MYMFALRRQVCVYVRAGGGGGGEYLLVSVAEIRYIHDVVRLRHKFNFCPFQMKIPHSDEEKELYALPIQGSVWYFLFWGLGGVDPKKLLEPRSGEKKFFRACRGSRRMLPRKSLNR